MRYFLIFFLFFLNLQFNCFGVYSKKKKIYKKHNHHYKQVYNHNIQRNIKNTKFYNKNRLLGKTNQTIAYTKATTEEPSKPKKNIENEMQVSVEPVPAEVKQFPSNFNPDSIKNNAVPAEILTDKEELDKKEKEKFNFDLMQFTEDEQIIMSYIDSHNVVELRKNRNIIFGNQKIGVYMFIKANELRGTIFNLQGIDMLEILLERNRNDFVLLTTLGIAVFENNEYFKAKKILEQALLRVNKYSHPEVIEQIKAILNKINDEILKIRGDFSVGYGFDDNPSYLSSAKTISIFNLELANAPIHSDFALNASGMLNYNWYFNDNIGSHGYINTNLNLYNKTNTRDMIILSAGDGLVFKSGKFKIDITGNYNRIWFGSNSILDNSYFIQNYGVSSNISYIFNKYFKGGVFFNYYVKDFLLIPEKNSNLFSAGLSLSFNPFYSTFIGLNIGNNYEIASLQAYSNNTFFVSLVLNQILNRYFSVTANMFYAHSNYFGQDPLTLVTRNENSLIAQVSLNYHITKNFIFSLIYKRIQNFSNAEIFNYNKNSYFASISFRF